MCRIIPNGGTDVVYVMCDEVHLVHPEHETLVLDKGIWAIHVARFDWRHRVGD